MSLPEQTARVQVTISTATDSISFPYKFIESDDLVVVSDGRGLLVEGVDYTVLGALDENGGSVEMIGATATEIVTVIRDTDISQALEISYGGAFFSEDVEAALDKLTKALQDAKEISDRSLKLPIGEIDGYVSILSAATARASKLLGFDENGAIALLTNGNSVTIPFHATIAASDESTALTTGTAKATFRVPSAFTLTEVRASVSTAPTGSTIIVDINEGGTSVLSTKLTIDATEKTSTTAATAAVISDSAIADDAEITIDIDQIGSTVAGAGLKVTLIGTL